MSPKISITLPNYNHGKYLKDCIQAVLSQTYGNFELLITDDGSTDQSRDIIDWYANRDNRIKPIYFSKNSGALAAHTACFSRAKGELLYSYSADDCITSSLFFEKAVVALAKFPQAGGVFGQAHICRSDGDLVTGAMGHAAPGFNSPASFTSGFLGPEPYFIPGISAIWRKECVDMVGGFRAEFGPQSDYFVNHCIAANYGVVFLNEYFAVARQFTDNSSYSGSAGLRADLASLRLFASEMARRTSSYSDLDEWERWWRRRYVRLIEKHFPYQSLR